ncbi:MAG TPA: hypothetical protein VKY59_10300 [Spirillospora sp.]|nr:hypothetical protein [Spirillospora sp.]
MSQSNLSDVQIQNLLTDLTSALLEGNGDLDALLAQYHVDDHDVQSLVELIGELNNTILPVEPSARFVRRLHQELIGMETGNVLVRVRRLPPRVQLAAGIALVAGFVILSRRRASSETRQEKQEHAAAQ